MGLLHVNDFNAMGTKEFHKMSLNMYVFGNKENRQYKFTWVDIKETSEDIEINQKQYCDSIQEIKIKDAKDGGVQAILGSNR